MDALETTIAIQIEITLGLKWGDPNSKIEQTDENREIWERIEGRTQFAGEQGWVVEIPNELPDISDFPANDIFILEED